MSLVSQLLVRNTQVEEASAAAARDVYTRVVRQIYWLMVILAAAVAVAGVLNIAATRRAFEEVRTLSGQLRALSWRMLKLQEDLQTSMARELHDEFGQILTAITMLLGRVKRRAGAGMEEEPLVRDLDEVHGIAQQTLERIRTQSRLLHPVILDDFGVEQALAWYVDQFSRQHGLPATFSTSGVGIVPPDIAIHIYRIVQEALGNASRHARASHAWVRLTQAQGILTLEVEDDGRGLPQWRGEAPAGAGGVGRDRRHWHDQHARTHRTGRRRADARPRRRRRPADPLRHPAEACLEHAVRIVAPPIRTIVDPIPMSKAGQPPAHAIRVVLVDDHALVRQGFRRILEDEEDILVVGEAGDGAETLNVLRAQQPDVVVLDMSMPEMNGLQVTREILKQFPGTRILILSMYSDEQYVRNAIDAGAHGYILKGSNGPDMVRAVRAVAAGQQYVSPELSGALIRAWQAKNAQGDTDPYDRLTQREKQVLQLIAQGKSNKEIAVLLDLSVNTVAVHRANLMNTLQLHKAAELVLFAVKKGLVIPE